MNKQVVNSVKRIAVLCDQLVLGGVQKAAAFEVFYLNKLGHQATLRPLMHKGFQKKFIKFFPKIPIEFISDSYPKLFRNSIKFPIFSFFSTLHLLSPFLAPSVIKTKDLDIIVAHGTTTCLTALSLWKKHRIPYIAIITDPMEYILKKVYADTFLKYFFWLISPILFYLERQIVKNAKIVVVISEKHLPFIQKHYQITPEILTLGTAAISKLSQKKGNYLIASSRWESGKNPQLLLEIIKALPKNKLYVVGNWTSRADLVSFRQKIKAENLSKKVFVKTDVPPKQLLKLYSQALLWVHPNVEAFGLAGFEAASCGCPIVMPAGSGLAHILKDRIDGFFPENITVEAFLKPVRLLVDNPDMAYSMGRHAWLTVRKGLSWKNHAKQLESLIGAALDKIELIALEIGHAQGTILAGGDKLLEEMSAYLSPNISLTIMIPRIADWHWRNKNAKVITVREGPFDNNPNPLAVFLTYIFRILTSTILLLKLPGKDIIYSSTNIFPDVMPAFFLKLVNPRMQWFARVHHLSPPPHKRPGNWLINAGSYFLQQISMLALKSGADLVAALNSNLAEQLTNNGFPKNKVVVVTAGIDINKWRSKTKSSSEKIYDAVFLGRMHPSKGIFDLVPIWSQVCQTLPQAKLAVIGHQIPSLSQQIIQQAKNQDIAGNIDLLGPLSDQDVQQHLKNSKIFLFTDHEAGFSLAGLEAMAVGLPIVGWDIGVLGYVFKKGFIKIKPFIINDFANAVVKLLENAQLLIKLSQQAKNEALKHDWKKVTVGFEKLLISLK